MSGKHEKANGKLHLVKDRWPVDTETPLQHAPEGGSVFEEGRAAEIDPASLGMPCCRSDREPGELLRLARAEAGEPPKRSPELEAAIKQLDAMRTRPVLLDVVSHFRRYYERHEETWGSLRVALEDGNTDDASVQACIDLAAREGDEHGEILARTLMRMSPSARRKVPKAVKAGLARIVVPDAHDGERDVEAECEAEGLPPITFAYCKSKMREWFPLDTPGTIDQKARKMYERHPFLARAYADGLRQGRDLRERSERGLGWEPWESLRALEPKERTYIMAKIREEIGVAQ